MSGRIRVVEIVGNGEGGGTKCVARIIRHLDPQRFAFSVIAPESRLLADACAETGAHFFPLPLLNGRVDRRLSRAFAAILSEVQPDIINGHGTRAAWYSLRARPHLTTVPAFVYSEHGFSFVARTGLGRIPWYLVERSICRHADALATSCGQNAQLAERRGWVLPERIAMRHYGIELQTFHDQAAHRFSRAELGVPEQVPLVGTVGRLVHQKGMSYFVDAARKVVDQAPSTIFLIIGDGTLRADLEQQSRRLGLSDHVRFLGAHDEPWRILSACDVVAFSSLYEGLPQTGIEALAAGRPMIFTRMQGTEELIRHEQNGLLVPTRNAQALAENILLLLRDPSLRARLAAAGPPSVVRRDTSIMVERFRTLYESLYVAREARNAANARNPAMAVGASKAR